MLCKDPHIHFQEDLEPVQLFIGDVKLGLLYKFYKKYQKDNIYRIPSIMEESIRNNLKVENNLNYMEHFVVKSNIYLKSTLLLICLIW